MAVPAASQELGFGWRALAGAALIVTGTLPPSTAWLCALSAIIVLGVPHGALDGEVARPLLRPRWGRPWFLVFALPYLSLAASVLVAWHVAPLPTLAGFLAASAWHFGSEDAGPAAGLEALVRGGLPVAMPVLVNPTATAAVFAAVTGTAMPSPPGWLLAASLSWLGCAALWCVQARVRALAEPALLIALFVLAPPLTAFAVYFVCLHAPRHMAGLVADARRAPRVQTMRGAVWLSLPVTALTLLIGAALWHAYAGPAPDRLLALTIQGLAALTLPHMLLEWATSAARPLSRLEAAPQLR